MSARTPEPEGSRAATAISDEDDVVDTDKVEVAVEEKKPRRTCRYANISDEERAEIEAAVATLWREYKSTKQEKLRERLILHYSPLVKYVAGRVGVGLPSNIEQADLVSYGIFGLIDAIEKFDL